MSSHLGCDTKRVSAAPLDGRHQPITEAQSNICSIRTHWLFIHANTSILKKLNGVSAPSLTRGISRIIYQDLVYDSPRPSLPITYSALTDRLRGLMGTDLYAWCCHCHYFIVGLQIMHDLGLKRQKETFPVCAGGRKYTSKNPHTKTRPHLPKERLHQANTDGLMGVMDICNHKCTNRSGHHSSTLLPP